MANPNNNVIELKALCLAVQHEKNEALWRDNSKLQPLKQTRAKNDSDIGLMYFKIKDIYCLVFET